MLVFQSILTNNVMMIQSFNVIILACYCLAAWLKSIAGDPLQTKCPWVRQLAIG